MKTTNMSGRQSTCVFVFLAFVNLQLIAGKPFLDDFFCDLWCDDDDILYDSTSTASTTTSLDDMFDALFDCSDCTPRRPTTPRTTTLSPAMQQPFSIVIPPSNTGMNLTVTNTGGSYLWQFMPWFGGQATPAPATTPAPSAATPAAPAATTPAAAGNATATNSTAA